MDIYIVAKYYLNEYKSTHLATASKDDALEFFDKQEKKLFLFLDYRKMERDRI